MGWTLKNALIVNNICFSAIDVEKMCGEKKINNFGKQQQLVKVVINEIHCIQSRIDRFKITLISNSMVLPAVYRCTEQRVNNGQRITSNIKIYSTN